MTTRFMQKGTSKFYFVPTIADSTLAPTVAEAGAGTEITDDVSDVSGFSFENDPIETPDMGQTFVGSIPGEDKADTSSLTIYERKTIAANTTRTALPKGTTGYLVIFPYGLAGATPAAADECDVWPIEVASVSRAYSAGNEASKYTITMTIRDEPGVDLDVLA